MSGMQLGFVFDDAAAQRLQHKWYGNVCPTCKAQPGELCKQQQCAFGHDSDERAEWIHGTRSRFERPGQCLGARCCDPDNCWGCEP